MRERLDLLFKWYVASKMLIWLGKKYICKHDCNRCRCGINEACALILVCDEFEKDGDPDDPA